MAESSLLIVTSCPSVMYVFIVIIPVMSPSVQNLLEYFLITPVCSFLQRETDLLEGHHHKTIHLHVHVTEVPKKKLVKLLSTDYPEPFDHDEVYILEFHGSYRTFSLEVETSKFGIGVQDVL